VTADQIAALTTAQIASLGSAQVANLSTAQLVAIETRDIGSITTANIAALTSAQVGKLSIEQVGVLTTAQIRAIDSGDLAALGTAQMTALTTAQIAALTTSQFSGFGTLQLSGIETGDLAAISTAQMTALTSVSITKLSAAYNGGSAFPSSTIEGWLTQATGVTSADVPALNGVTPMVLDLDGNGIQTLSVQNGVTFDIDNNGTLERTGWVARGDGLLVRDLNGDGVINNGGELFGSGTVLADGSKAADGYAAMRALDSNLDGILDANDAAFGQLAVWADADGDGLTDAGELQKLADLGITSLSLNSTASTEVNNGNLIGLMGSYTKSDGSTHTMGDVWFQVDTAGNKVFDLAAVAQAAGGANINLANAQTETLKVTLAEVLAVGEADILSGHSSVTINGDASDTVQLAGTWSYAGTQTDGADTYMVYVNQNAQLLVNDKIHTIIG